MSNEPANTLATSLFDPGPRTDMRMQGYSEPAFEFLNRSAWACLEAARPVLDLWLSRIPPANGKDLQGRFQGDDKRHLGALMELVTHEILRATGTDVKVAPDLGGRTPDFSFNYRGEKILVECTVAQDSQAVFSSMQDENVIKDHVDTLETGELGVLLQVRQRGRGQPPTRGFLAQIKESSRAAHGREYPQSAQLSGRGWDVKADLISASGQGGDGGALAAVIGPVEEVTSDLGLWNALRKKAGRYKSPHSPYVIVLGDNKCWPAPEALLSALFGPKKWVLGSGHGYETWSCQRFFGSPSRPRNRHVSAVLYKQGFRSVWSVCEDREPWQWQLYHHPEAENPLPKGVFPFAIERFFQNGRPAETKPSCTLNALLNLPEPWPGTEH